MRGGISLTHEHGLRFSIEESVWFQNGQEVAELMTISLDPNITIKEDEQFVYVKGVLELSGEYIACEEKIDEEESKSYPSYKFVRHVEQKEDGVHLFSHSLPIDITIPTSRIGKIEDVDVIIDTFDYVLPEKACLQLTANVTITGIQEESTSQNVEYELAYRSSALDVSESTTEEVEGKDQDYDDTLFDTFEGEAKKQPEHSYGEHPFSIPIQYNDTYPSLTPLDGEEEKRQESEQARYHHAFDEPYPLESSSSKTLSFDESSNAPPSESYAEQVHDYSYDQPHVNDSQEDELLTEYESFSEDESSSSESFEEEPVQQKKKKKKKSDGISLTEFFARKEEETSARLKVCIVQEGETIEDLAERYQISVQQLLRVNHLEPTQGVYEGQVLYIPTSVTINK
jgi:stage VI sporulation protein D